MDESGATIVISQRPQRNRPLDTDLDIYKRRHSIENRVCKIEGFERIAVRSDKTDRVFAAMIRADSVLGHTR